ncbi:hypothetical protein GOBAR_AA36421 [Gossypium barbadense]|uniref:Small EDRK-rich factor-like N-terminal domain-containing protein n=1 Tax=Gossypium barbadense TaxID=3634 RepID=A0A2P5VZP3_GOSBA|nr:hypothetical protein GOBAR_AA36421 [Gossypium barbadense]
MIRATKGKAGSKDDGLTPEQRRERDAKALQEKAAKKAAQAAAGGNPAGDDGGKTVDKDGLEENAKTTERKEGKV